MLIKFNSIYTIPWHLELLCWSSTVGWL